VCSRVGVKVPVVGEGVKTHMPLLLGVKVHMRFLTRMP
jgi:hypothetical protein